MKPEEKQTNAHNHNENLALPLELTWKKLPSLKAAATP
jgi:hypothetical protein